MSSRSTDAARSYDVKLASGVITQQHIGILVAVGDHYLCRGGQAVRREAYAAAMFQVFLVRYLIYIIGWALINPKVAALKEELTKFRA